MGDHVEQRQIIQAEATLDQPDSRKPPEDPNCPIS